MAKFREIPKTVEAVQWFPGVKHERVVEQDRQIGKTYFHAYILRQWPNENHPFGIKPGEWIIVGQEMPMSDALFKRSYEPVIESPKIEEIDIEVPQPTDASKVQTETLTIRPSRRQPVQGKPSP